MACGTRNIQQFMLWRARPARHKVTEGDQLLLLLFNLCVFESTTGPNKPDVVTGALSSVFFSFSNICIKLAKDAGGGD